LRRNALNSLPLLLVPALIAVAGCGGRVSAFSPVTAEHVAVSATATHIDTNGRTQYLATLPGGDPAPVEWSVSGGDPTAGPGHISADGLYTPPSYLTQDAVTVRVNALPVGQATQPGIQLGSAALIVTPGFLQPLTPENLALGPNASVTISGSMTEVGGSGGIRFTLASDTAGTRSEAGSLGPPHCIRRAVASSNPAYTVCTVAYTAPAVIPASTSVYVVGTVPSGTADASPSHSWTRVLLNAAGITSNPAAHQAHLAVPVQLGSSSGNNSDYDSSQGLLADCCGGTLGALIQDAAGTQYVLSNNHVLARSDQSMAGETIIQPGLIDNACTPFGYGPGATPVATLTGYPALSSPATNVDAAIARVTPGSVDAKGNILELGARQSDGTLASAPPGISSTNGKGEAASLGMMVAKSGRTTGLTCAAVSAVSVDVVVDYFTDCAETSHSMTKTFTNQIAISGPSFSDAGDSGALVVDTANAEPVGLFFAGGTDANGVEHAIANPAGDVLAALDLQIPTPTGPANYSFVGAADHPVSCLSYGGARSLKQPAGESIAGLSAAEVQRAEAALQLAQLQLNPTVLRTEAATSKDHPGEAGIAFHLEPGSSANLPNFIGGVPTMVVQANGSPAETQQPRGAALAQAIAAKQRNAAAILKANPAIFGVGVGQSLDNPADAAIMLFVDRTKAPGKLPESVEGQRVRVILMDRLHVTRAHGQPESSVSSCQSRARAASEDESELLPFNNRLSDDDR